MIFLAFFVPFPYSDRVDVIVILFVCVSHQSFVPQFSTACFGHKLTPIFGVQSCHSVIQSGSDASFPDSLHSPPHWLVQIPVVSTQRLGLCLL